ncbi:deiodinase-like protein [Mycobacterium sp.]|uniref:TlpA family protein disulfide reductase n=1 Tax=Mycobacterium sp. TaxID=1785 RepID=UPI001275CD48|nr:deiodinase-like protein [Mycobacterium sp.]KAA8962457.1 MAG: redoxin domain-containing protein [Mycobacterium sp.]
MTDTNSAVTAYNYDHFGLEHRSMDHLGGVAVGEPAPDFTATRLDGTEVKLSDFRGKPVVLETGSASCPMYVGHIEPMNALAFRFPDVAFLVLYVREAHPGRRIGAHRDHAQKTAAARIVADQEQEGRTILIDDLAGTAHRLYGAMPNTVHVIDTDGRVAFRAMWNDPAAVEAVLRTMLAGQDTATVRARFRPTGPATLFRVLRRAGWRAVWDFVVAFPALARAHLRPGRPGAAE